MSNTGDEYMKTKMADIRRRAAAEIQRQGEETMYSLLTTGKPPEPTDMLEQMRRVVDELDKLHPAEDRITDLICRPKHIKAIERRVESLPGKPCFTDWKPESPSIAATYGGIALHPVETEAEAMEVMEDLQRRGVKWGVFDEPRLRMWATLVVCGELYIPMHQSRYGYVIFTNMER